MRIKILLLTAVMVLGACTSDHDPGNFKKSAEKTPAELNKIQEVELETRASNETDESNYYKATLFLTDYDRSKNQAVAVIDGFFAGSANTEFSPYVNEVCFTGDSCGLTFTSIASLEDITVEQAIGEINRTGLKDAHDVDKSLYKNGSVFLIHSETRETEKSPVWSITVAVEIVDFKKNAKRVKIRYKVLQYKLKEYNA